MTKSVVKKMVTPSVTESELCTLFGKDKLITYTRARQGVRVPKAQSTLLYDTLPVLHGMFYDEKDRIVMRRIALL